MSFVTQIRVRNPNWGPLKFRDCIIVFTYQVNSNVLPSKSALGNEVNSGLLLLTSTIDLKGKVELMLIMKTTKTAELSCSMVFNLAARSLQNLDCN
ncbi:unnamed protein product [Prunus armeniaca]|uniref:Late embryogenesis abundant protein LEA-2 subgroup domain-containing protein n=1 Tax=Prunus armeniaca TaxID=36596 RepID=A0A6J5TR72_PRUAR|nr:unnamed protein product [Prunus armeniaca]